MAIIVSLRCVSVSYTDSFLSLGQAYSEALAMTRVDGRHVEDIHETVNDLNCRHGLYYSAKSLSIVQPINQQTNSHIFLYCHIMGR